MMKFVLIMILGFAGLATRAETQAPYDFVQVSGEGEIKIKPEYALITATVFR